MTDRELLERAAKAAQAAGMPVRIADEHGYDGDDKIHAVMLDTSCTKIVAIWNPLADDGDALRLAVRLGLALSHGRSTDPASPWRSVLAWKGPIDDPAASASIGYRVDREDGCAATRRAIVTAAASLAPEVPA